MVVWLIDSFLKLVVCVAEDTRIIGVSLKGMLADLVRQLPAFDPLFDTWYRYGGFFSHVRVYVPDLAVPVKLHEEFSSSVREFRTAEEAEEKASEGMIRTLEKNYNFEVKDLNWWDKRQFHFNSYNSCTGWRRAEEENQAFKMKVEALTSGWRRTLEGLDRWCDLVPSAGYASPEDALPVVFYHMEGLLSLIIVETISRIRRCYPADHSRKIVSK